MVPVGSVACAWGFAQHYGSLGGEPDSLTPVLDFAVRFELPAAYLLTVLLAAPYILSIRARGLLDFFTLMTPLTVVASSLAVLVCIVAPSFKHCAACAGVGIISAGLSFYFLSVCRNPASTAKRLHAAASVASRKDPRL
jgi:hypothetical protein